MTDELDLLEDLLDAQDKTDQTINDLLARVKRIETRLVVLINALGHGDKIDGKGTV